MHSGSSGGGVRCSRKELQSTETAAAIRKGPWMAEEDAVLIEYVKRYGPRDWSSIRSKGLLPRTGKSCRLRWLNKLRPDLKTGCKFSAEEEWVVIDLQARVGNKWARIATYLPGRTDNDVKNFWSTRQKRLARLLQTPLPVGSRRNQGKVPMPPEAPMFEPNCNSGDLPYNDPQCLDLIPFTAECANSKCIHPPFVEEPDAMKMVLMPSLDLPLSLLKPAITDRELCLPSSSSSAPQSPFDHSLPDLPLLSEGQDLVLEFGEMSSPGQFCCAESSQVMQLPPPSSLLDLQFGDHGVKIEHPATPESFFGDFPADMFEFMDQPPVS